VCWDCCVVPLAFVFVDAYVAADWRVSGRLLVLAGVVLAILFWYGMLYGMFVGHWNCCVWVPRVLLNALCIMGGLYIAP